MDTAQTRSTLLQCSKTSHLINSAASERCLLIISFIFNIRFSRLPLKTKIAVPKQKPKALFHLLRFFSLIDYTTPNIRFKTVLFIFSVLWFLALLVLYSFFWSSGIIFIWSSEFCLPTKLDILVLWLIFIQSSDFGLMYLSRN